MQDGLLKLQRSGLRLRTLQEVLARAHSFYRVQLFIVPSPVVVLCFFWFCALISLRPLRNVCLRKFEICCAHVSRDILAYLPHVCSVGLNAFSPKHMFLF
jgi:hypothetical protein